MAGPAIRSWEFANQLSKNHNVVVLCPNQSELKPKSFTLKQINKKVFAQELKNADFLIAQTVKQKTVVFVSHDMKAVVKFCDKAILIDDSKMVMQGKPELIAKRYLKLNNIKEVSDINSINDKSGETN